MPSSCWRSNRYLFSRLRFDAAGCRARGSNARPPDHEARALPTEPPRPVKMQISVWQNWNSFNVVISVLIYQGGHSALYTYDKLLTGKKICLKDFWPFLIPNLRGQPLLLGITRKVLSFQTCFVLQVFRNS